MFTKEITTKTNNSNLAQDIIIKYSIFGIVFWKFKIIDNGKSI